MHIPLVGERVWVRGCSHPFIVQHADYSRSVATLSPVELSADVRTCPFGLLSLMHDFPASPAELSPAEASDGVLQATKQCIHASRVAMVQMREAAQRTRSLIENSQKLIRETDRNVARWSFLSLKRV